MNFLVGSLVLSGGERIILSGATEDVPKRFIRTPSAIPMFSGL